jgi:hypothetical protein
MLCCYANHKRASCMGTPFQASRNRKVLVTLQANYYLYCSHLL